MSEKREDRRMAALPVLRERLCRDILQSPAMITVGQPTEWLLASMASDGTWGDVVYEPGALKDWAAAVHLARLLAMAREWRSMDRPADGPLLDAVRRGLDAWYSRGLVNPNWWWNQIGAPMLLGDTLLLVKDACDRSFVERAVPALCCHQPVLRFTGQNLVWTAGVEIRHGLLADDPDIVSQAFILIGRELRVLPGAEGLQPDMSFFQHGKLLYSGGYGQWFAADVARLIRLASGTVYAFPEHMVDLLARYLLDGSRWMVRGRTFEYGAIGREITRAGHSAAGFFRGATHMAEVEHPRRAEFAAIAGDGGRGGRSFVTGNRHFWCADLMVHHRPGFYVSVRMPSSRILNADAPCCGGEGRLCHHMAEGATFIMRDGEEYRDVFAAWNWRQIPGVTVEQDEGEFDPDGLRHLGERAFAGGASDGRTGCAAVDFSRRTLRAKKAWFLFDDGMVALGAGIGSSSGAPVRTTINQCLRRSEVQMTGVSGPLPEGLYPLAEGASFRHDGLAYHVLAGQGSLAVTVQRGRWSDCGVGPSDLLDKPVLNAGLEHGSSPDGAAYAYVVRPDAGAEQADEVAGLFRIVRNDARAQAVWHERARAGQVAYYEPGSVTFPDGQAIAVDLPCILLYRPDGCRAVLTLAQPEQRDGQVTLTLSGRLSGRVGVSLPAREYAGSSLTLSVG